MADTATLHADTNAWLGAWRAYMDSLDAAYNDLVPGLVGVGNKGDRPNQSAGTYAAEIGQNEAFGMVRTNPYSDKETEGEDGFPKADSLIAEYLSVHRTEKTQERLIALARQLNVLEAFRKKHLVEKQTKADVLQYLQVMRRQGAIIRREFEHLLQGLREEENTP